MNGRLTPEEIKALFNCLQSGRGMDISPFLMLHDAAERRNYTFTLSCQNQTDGINYETLLWGVCQIGGFGELLLNKADLEKFWELVEKMEAKYKSYTTMTPKSALITDHVVGL